MGAFFAYKRPFLSVISLILAKFFDCFWKRPKNNRCLQSLIEKGRGNGPDEALATCCLSTRCYILPLNDEGKISRHTFCVRTLLSKGFILIDRSEEHTSELQSRENLVCCLLLE